MSNNLFEVIVIGGGPAGLSAGLVLGRSRINTLLLNTEKPRNLVTTHSHGFLTQDGKHPSEIFAVAKQQLDKYEKVSYKVEKALKIEKDTFFNIETKDEIFRAKRVVIATGHQDNISEIGIEGLIEVYGKSVYPCPFCDGYELADKKLAVIGDSFLAPMFAKTIAHWSSNVIVFTNGEIVKDKDLIRQLKEKKIEIIDSIISKLISKNGLLQYVELEDGTRIEREGGFLPDTNSTESSNFAKQLKVPTKIDAFEMETYIVDDNKETEINGLYIIGDARTGWSGVAESVAEGSIVGAAITHQIIEENWNN